MPAVNVVFIGPAGSGKTSLVKSYLDWARSKLFLRVATVNLDPGAENIRYDPVFDIRRYFTLRDVMEKYNLGPNGAFLKASELVANMTSEIISSPPFSERDQWDLILIDTPGQMEAFIFRPSSHVFLEAVRRLGNTIIAYVIDASAIERVSDAIFLWFIYVLLQVKTGLYAVPIINKRDIAKNIEIVKKLVESPESLLEEEIAEGLASEIIPDLVRIASKTKGPFRSVLVSALDSNDMEKMHVILHEAFCACGDLT